VFTAPVAADETGRSEQAPLAPALPGTGGSR